MKKSLCLLFFTMCSISEYAAMHDWKEELAEIKNSEAYKKELELSTLLEQNQDDPNILFKIENLLKQGVNPNFSTLKKINHTGSALHAAIYTIADHDLAQNVMNLLLEYGADPNAIFSEDYSPGYITPLEFLFTSSVEYSRHDRHLPLLTNDQKVNFIKILWRNGASIFDTPYAKSLKRRNLVTLLPSQPLMHRAMQELKQESLEEERQAKALQAFIQEGRPNTGIFDVTRKSLGLSASRFE